jgi:hypothetical protein
MSQINNTTVNTHIEKTGRGQNTFKKNEDVKEKDWRLER